MTNTFSTKDFLKDTSGTMTMWNIISMIGLISIGGLAVDTSNAWRVKAMLQNTADASALAAAIHFEDQSEATRMAVDFARRNMPHGAHGDVVRSSDVEFGTFDSATQTFTPTTIDPNSVRVVAGRDNARANAVSTYLLKLAGVSDWEVGRSAVAFPRWGGGSENACPGAVVLAVGLLNAGGNNTLVDQSCFHGQLGISSDGGDFFDPSVQLSSTNVDDIIIDWLREGSAPLTSVAKQKDMKLTLLPSLDGHFDRLWGALWDSGIEQYSGDLVPDYLKDAKGTVNVVAIDEGTWDIAASELAEHTVYLVRGDAKFLEPTTAQNIAIIATGDITSTSQSAFQNVMFFAEGAVDFGGPTTWGDKTSYCEDGAFNSYLLSGSYIAMGGAGGGLFGSMLAETAGKFEGQSSAHGVVAAAPIMIPGGSFLDVGSIYIESSAPYATLGGDMNTTNSCSDKLSAHFETTSFDSEPQVVGSSLRHAAPTQ